VWCCTAAGTSAPFGKPDTTLLVLFCDHVVHNAWAYHVGRPVEASNLAMPQKDTLLPVERRCPGALLLRRTQRIQLRSFLSAAYALLLFAVCGI
jgi:hypothetical protein